MAGGARRLKFDLFCTVVDNYGDIGVCWRLARQLAAGHGIAVRLWLDDLTSLERIAQGMEVAGVEVRHWTRPFPDAEPADVVIEAFACEIPENYVAAMAACTVKPVWINLEYLSAEAWVDECHLGRSRHPGLPLTKIFYFPGFTARTGGLLREAGSAQGFDATAFWPRLGLPLPQDDELRVSMFGYDNPALNHLLMEWAGGNRPVTCLIPQGHLADRARQLVGSGRGPLRVHEFPFMSQDDYDRLLRACDVNFVRGEDSFVRAQWAAKPFVWHIYPQQDDAHLLKLEAFVARYCAGLPDAAAQTLRDFWLGWNAGAASGWEGFWQYRTQLDRHAVEWKQTLSCQPDLAASLVAFCESQAGSA